MDGYVLSVNGLSYQRDNRMLFENLTFQLYPGQALHIIGTNGSGKTTLLQILIGFIEPLRGYVSWHGVSIDKSTFNFKQNLLYINHRLGMQTMLSPSENLYLLLTRRDLVSTKTKQKVQNNIKRVLDQLGLSLYAHSLTGKLSLGQQRRLALAKLLLLKADCWILDEPFISLDKNGVILLSSLIEEQRHRGGIVIFTSHQLNYSLHKNIKKIFLDIQCV